MKAPKVPADWTPAEREAWINAELRGEPVMRAMPEHDEGECDHCDVLRELQREADRRADAPHAP